MSCSWSNGKVNIGEGLAISLFTITALWLPDAAIADDEKVLNIYNWADYIGEDTLADFQSEYGIKINYDIYESSEIVDAKLMAGNTGYDVVIHSAAFSGRLIPVGIYQPLDKSKLTNLSNLDPRVLELLAETDPGNRYAIPYMWGTTGFSYNAEMIRERMPDAPLASGDMIFNPEVVSHFADCGVSFLDSPTDVIPMALIYLGLEGNSSDPEEIAQAEKVLQGVRPYIKYFSSTKLLMDLPNKEICIAMSWSGDYATAYVRAEEAGVDIELAYTIPEEGTASWVDGVYIPSDAPHPNNAHLFLDFLMRPEVIAAISNKTNYANGNEASTPLVNPEIVNNPAIYATDEVLGHSTVQKLFPPKIERIRTRVWSRVKTGM